MFEANRGMIIEPCPFCGYDDVTTVITSQACLLPAVHVQCRECGCLGPCVPIRCEIGKDLQGREKISYDGEYKKRTAESEKKAIEFWNERVYNIYHGRRARLKKGSDEEVDKALKIIKEENPEIYKLEKLSWALLARVYRNVESVAMNRIELGATSEDIKVTYSEYMKEAKKAGPKRCKQLTLWYALEDATKLGIKNKWYNEDAYTKAKNNGAFIFSNLNDVFTWSNKLHSALRILKNEHYNFTAEVAAKQRKSEERKNKNGKN